MASFVPFSTLNVRPFVSARIPQARGLPLDIHFADAAMADVHGDTAISYGLYATGLDTFTAAARAPHSSVRPEPARARPRGIMERSISEILEQVNERGKHSVAVDFASVEPLFYSAEAAAHTILNGIQLYLQHLDAAERHNDIGSIVISREQTPISRLQPAYENLVTRFFPNAVPLRIEEPSSTPEGRMVIDTTGGPLLVPLPTRTREMTLRFRSYRRRSAPDPVEVLHRVTTAAFLREAVYSTTTFICCKDDEEYVLYLMRAQGNRHAAPYNHDTIREALALLDACFGNKEEAFVEKGYIRPVGNSFVLSRLTTPSVPDTLRISSVLVMQPALSGANQLLAFLSSIGIEARVEGEEDDTSSQARRSFARIDL